MPPKKRQDSSLSPSELFYPLHIEDVSAKGKKFSIVADAKQCAAIAERLNLLSVENLSADVTVDTQNGGHVLYISGHFVVDIVQECVATLEPVNDHLEDDFEAWYADHDKAVSFARAKHKVKTMEEGDEIPVLEEQEDPEPLTDGQVDIGEVVIQFLSLSINPYPRKEGAESMGNDDTAEISQTSKQNASLRPNPFAALKNWRPKD